MSGETTAENQNGDQVVTQLPRLSDASEHPTTRPHPFRFATSEFTPRSAKEFDEAVRRIEALGYSIFVTADHLNPDTMAAVPALLAAARATSHLRICTTVHDNNLRHPAMLAKEAATLDFLTDGRLEFGIGAGYAREEYASAGLPYDSGVVRVERLEEAVRIIKDLWAGEPVTFSGRHYSIAGLTNYPRPIQRPRPPILIAGGGRRILTLAAREADIVGIIAQASPEGNLRVDEDTLGLIEQKIGWLKSAAGLRFGDLELAILIWDVRVTDHPAESAEDLARERGLTSRQVLDSPYFLIGSVDSITESLIGLRERFGISHVSVFPRDSEAFAPVVARLAGQ